MSGSDPYECGLQDGIAMGHREAAKDMRADAAEIKMLRSALQNLVDALAANDEDGLTEFADVMTAAREALKA